MVLFASYSGMLGGAERLLLDWTLAVQDERCIACPDGVFADAARAAGIRVFKLVRRPLALRAGVGQRAAAVAALAAHRRELLELVERIDPDVVVLGGMRTAIAGAAFGGLHKRRNAVVFQASDLLPGPAIGRLVRRAARRTDLVLAPSRAVAADLDPDGLLGVRLEVVHPGIDPDRFNPWATPAVPPEVLVVGAIADSKRPDLALEVLALARRAHPELRLMVAGAPVTQGDEQLLAKLRTRAAAPDLAGSVELLGAVEDTASALGRATCLLHCAPREAFGMAVLEALAAGRPAVVPATGGPVEIIDESCGILYEPEDAEAAAGALVRLAADQALAREMGAAGRRRAKQQFGRADARRRWAAALERIRPAARRAPASAHELEIVTVTHNSEAVLGGLLGSAARHLPEARVVVVDSGSADGTPEVAERFASARVVALERNVGFGAACNAGVLEVSAPVVALLNPDVELLDGSLLELVAELRRPGAPDRLLAPLVLNTDGTRQDTAHPEPGSPADVLRAVISPSVLPGAGASALEPWRARRPRRISWAVGCALVSRTETLRRLGPFDERLFMYGEDLDLCLRAGEAGVETWFWPAARIVHHRAHSSAAAFGGEPFELLARARHEVVARRLGEFRAVVDDVAQALTFASRVAVKEVLGRPAARERRQLEALRAARRGR